MKMQKTVFCLSSAIIALAIFFGAAGCANAQTASGFPSDEAGIAAYVKLETISRATFDQAKDNLFDYVESCGETYMIGVKAYSATGEYSNGVPQNKIDIRIYLGADGWLAAYLKKNETTSRIVNWQAGALLGETLLKAAIEDGLARIGGTAAGEMQYHDFANDGAFKMTLVRESITPNETDPSGAVVSSKNFSVLVQGTAKDFSWALKSINGSCPLGTGTVPITFWVDSNLILKGGCSKFTYGNHMETIFNDRQSHIVEMKKSQPWVDGAGVFVFIYGN